LTFTYPDIETGICITVAADFDWSGFGGMGGSPFAGALGGAYGAAGAIAGRG
jgi:hypothetical protein